MNRNLIFSLLLLLCVFHNGFAAESNWLQRPMPDDWNDTEAISQQLPASDPWWVYFDDAALDTLISMGQDANLNLEIAMRRMEAARRQVDVARAAYFPQIGVNAGYTRSYADRTGANRWTVQGTMNWELDLFGRVTAQVRQKKAQYNASRADYTAAMVSMAASIATTYVELRVAQAQLNVAREQLASQDSIATLVQARYDAGLGAKPQVDQAMALVHATRATIPALRTQVESYTNALALLVGRYPDEIVGLVNDGRPIPDYRQLVGTGVPAELLRRRPDIVAAEASIASAAAAVGIAKKDYLPSLSLTGSVGVAAARPGDMFTRNGFTYSVGPTLSWTVFDGLARPATVAAAREEMEAQIANYNYLVMNAYNEVQNAIIAYINSTAQIADYERALQATREFLELELDLYTQGLAPYNDVATAQQNVLDRTNSLLTARGSALSSLISLYQALGGGF